MLLHDIAHSFDIHFNVFGILDSYDACHTRVVGMMNMDSQECLHECIWPTATRRWRIDDCRGQMWHLGWEPTELEKDYIWQKAFEAAYNYVIRNLN